MKNFSDISIKKPQLFRRIMSHLQMPVVRLMVPLQSVKQITLSQ